MTMANFDIGSAAAQVLRRVPSATGGRPDIVKQTLLCLGGFFVADALAYLILHVVLPSRIDRFKSVNIRQAIISILHCTASIPMVFMLFGNVTNADAGPGGLLGYGPLTYIPMANIDLAASLFLGFLLWDLLHNLAYRDVYSKSIVESMIHHTGFITAMYLNKDTLWCNYAFPFLYLGEISTLFLSVRIVYRMLDVPESLASWGFALTFFVTRIIVFGLLVAQLFSQAFQLMALLSPMLQLSYLVLVPALYGLNWYWWLKIYRNAMKVMSGERSASETTHSEQEKAE